MKTLFRFIAIQTLVTSLALAQWLGYGTSQYLYPDSTSGGLGWRTYSTNGTLSFWDDVNARATFRFGTNGALTFADGTIQSTAGLTPSAVTNLIQTATNQSALSATQVIPYVLSATNLTVTLQASTWTWADGATNAVSSQTIVLSASSTNWVGIDCYDQSLHTYIRPLDMGTKFIAAIVTGTTSATSIQYLATDTYAPPHRFESTKQKYLGGTNYTLTTVLGDSISGPYPGYTTNWVDCLFNQSSWSTNYISHTAPWTVQNYAVGTQTPWMAMTMACSSTVETPVSNFVNSATSGSGGEFGYADPYYTHLISGANSLVSPVLAASPDLIIVGHYNSDPYFMQYTERVVQRARMAGAAVILHDTQGNIGTGGSTTNEIEYGPQLKKIADAHGAMFLDTWARSYEYRIVNSNTPSINADTGANVLHPNDLGSLYFSKWVRSMFAAGGQKSERIEPLKRMVSLPNTTYAQYTFPFGMELQCIPVQPSGNSSYSTNIQFYNPAVFNSANPAIIVSQRTASNGAVAVPSGSSVFVSHPCALNIGLLVDATSAFGWTLSMSSVTVASGSYGGAGGRPGLVSLANIETLRNVTNSAAWNHGPADYFVNGTFKISITSGTAIIYAAVFGVPAKKTIPLNQMDWVGGGWDLTNRNAINWVSSGATNTYTINSSIPARGTDVSGDYVLIPFVGAGIQALVETGKSGGQINVWLDGQQITSMNGGLTLAPFDAYLGATRYTPINIMVKQGWADGNGLVARPHVLKLQYNGSANGSALSPFGYDFRRFKLLSATAFGPADVQ